MILPQHVAGRVQGHRPSLHLVSQEEFQDLVMHTLSRHVCGFPPSPIMQLQVCAVKQEESGRVIATIGGRKEERRLTLSEKGESQGLTEKSLMSLNVCNMNKTHRKMFIHHNQSGLALLSCRSTAAP